MKSTVVVQVDTDTMLRLISHLKVRGGAQDVAEAIDSAITLWLREQSQLPFNRDPGSVRGYQWKSLFLPEGTEIRSWSYGEHNYARVVGDEIIHKGKSVTPNEFAQSFARSMRNAWMDLSVRRPQDKQFKMAHRLRLELTEAATRPQTAGWGAGAGTGAGAGAALAPAPALAPALAPPPALADTSIAALLSALQAQLQAAQALASSAAPERAVQPGPPRPLPAGEGWNLPERRKFRFRLEDVAFD